MSAAEEDPSIAEVDDPDVVPIEVSVPAEVPSPPVAVSTPPRGPVTDVPPVAALASRPAVTDVPPSPKRGGVHPLYSTYLGGAKLDDEYKSVISIGRGNGVYRFSTQRRHEKTIGNIEKTLQDARDSVTSLKFHGKLEPAEGSLTEIGKERFLLILERKVTEHGQQTFYHVKDTDDKVVNLFENSHRFTLETVIAEHERRCQADNSAYEQYDQYELDEIELSRLLVMSLCSEGFLDTIRV